MKSMRRHCRRAVFLVALLASPTLFAQSTDHSPEHQIRQVLAAQVAAWNRGDIPAFMNGYANSPRTTFVGTSIEQGYASILARYLRKYPTSDAMGHLEFDGLEVRMLGASHAVVTGYFHLRRTAAAGGNASGVFSLVFEKERAGWKIILDHTS
ncbi:MAG: nuclear transport factor 2 family protein [Acidobacteriaceae bacterium]